MIDLVLVRRVWLCAVVSCFVLTLSVPVAWAAPMALVDPGLVGTTQYDEWAAGSLSADANKGFPSFPGTDAWPGPIGSSAPGSGDANLNKVANGVGGGPYPQSAFIYAGGFSGNPNTLGGKLSVTDDTPVPSVDKIVFQIQIGEAFGHDFFNDVLPTLVYNGTSEALPADAVTLLESFDNGTFETPEGEEEPIYVNTYLLEWDVSAFGVNSFEIGFSVVQHSQLHAMRLDQVAVVVPEPATVTLAGAGLIGLAAVLRARRRPRRR